MDPGGVPAELSGLIQVEEILNTRAAAIMRDYRRKGGQSQRGYGGHVANVAQDVGELLSRLRGAATDVAVFSVRREGHEDGTHKVLLARRFRVLDTLVWRQLNTPYYRNLQQTTRLYKCCRRPVSIQATSKLPNRCVLLHARTKYDTGPHQGGAMRGQEESEFLLRSTTDRTGRGGRHQSQRTRRMAAHGEDAPQRLKNDWTWLHVLPHVLSPR